MARVISKQTFSACFERPLKFPPSFQKERPHLLLTFWNVLLCVWGWGLKDNLGSDLLLAGVQDTTCSVPLLILGREEKVSALKGEVWQLLCDQSHPPASPARLWDICVCSRW